MGAVDDAKKYLSLRPPMENKTIFALHPDVLVAGLLDEIERLRGALRSIDNLIPKTKEITGLPYCMAIAGDIAESALNGTWPAYGIMPAPAKEKE